MMLMLFCITEPLGLQLLILYNINFLSVYKKKKIIIQHWDHPSNLQAITCTFFPHKKKDPHAQINVAISHHPHETR